MSTNRQMNSNNNKPFFDSFNTQSRKQDNNEISNNRTEDTRNMNPRRTEPRNTQNNNSYNPRGRNNNYRPQRSNYHNNNYRGQNYRNNNNRHYSNNNQKVWNKNTSNNNNNNRSPVHRSTRTDTRNLPKDFLNKNEQARKRFNKRHDNDKEKRKQDAYKLAARDYQHELGFDIEEEDTKGVYTKSGSTQESTTTTTTDDKTEEIKEDTKKMHETCNDMTFWKNTLVTDVDNLSDISD